MKVTQLTIQRVPNRERAILTIEFEDDRPAEELMICCQPDSCGNWENAPLDKIKFLAELIQVGQGRRDATPFLDERE